MNPKKEAAKELLRRKAARQGLIDFTRYTFPRYRPSEHHHLIAGRLEAVERGDLKRLMIFMPPRHGKSELASKRFPAWCLGRDQDKNFISASYNSELAKDFGREVRNIIRDQEYLNIFPKTHIASDSGAADRWHTGGLGGYVAAGIGTAVTGRGAHIFTIDDPVKDREQAESETQRRRIYDWYTSTAYTRLESSVHEQEEDDWLWDVGGAIKDGIVKPFEGAIVIIQTRWHEDDLSGRLIEDMENGADQWEILELPAINEKKHIALWPQKFSIDRLESIKSAIGTRDWSALYQQRPQPEDGTYFLRDWFHTYTDTPKEMTIWMTSDYAVKEDKNSDYTEHSIWGIDCNSNIYLLDNWHGQKATNTWIDEGLKLVRKWKPYVWFGEGGVIRHAVQPSLKKAMEEQGTFIRLEWLNSIVDKTVKARAFQARASMGKVFLPATDIGERGLDQLIRFPAGKHDDFVDTCSFIGMVIDQAHEAYISPVKKVDILRKPTFNDMIKSNGSQRTERI